MERGRRAAAPLGKVVISSVERYSVRSREISRATLRIHLFRTIASPSLWGGAHMREHVGGEVERKSIYCRRQFDMPRSGLDKAATRRGIDMRRIGRRVAAEF